MTNKQTVFIVDDDDFFRSMLQEIFCSAGFEVAAFARADHFLSTCSDTAESCLILDLRMPLVGGLELQRVLRRRGIDLPVIIYTGNADVPVAVRAMREGAFSVIEKPVNSELLIEQVREAIAASRRRRARRDRITDARNRLAALTEREREIAYSLGEGLSAPELAGRLALSARTIEAHRANLFRKLKIRSGIDLGRLTLLAEMDDD